MLLYVLDDNVQVYIDEDSDDPGELSVCYVYIIMFVHVCLSVSHEMIMFKFISTKTYMTLRPLATVSQIFSTTSGQ